MVVGFFSLLGGVTGILVETAIAAKLGLSRESDIFYVAYTLPYIITNLISATSQFSLVPFFASLDARQSHEELSHGFSYAVNVVFLGLGAIALLGAAASPWLIRGIAPGLSAPQIALSTELARWLFLVIIPAGVTEVLRSFLLSRQSFALPSSANFFRNGAVIVTVLLTFHRFGYYSIVLGYYAGYCLQLSVLAAQMQFSFPVRYAWTLRAGGEAFRNLRGAGTAQVGGALAWQTVVVVERIIASFLPAGTLTALNWGLKIMTTLAELLAGSVGTVALPGLSRAAARKEEGEQHETFRNTLEISLVLVSPVTVFCLLLDRNIIRLIFERGHFTSDATAMMSLIFFYYSLCLPLYSLIRVLTFHLFARNEVRIFFRLAVFLYALTVALDLFYVGVLRLGAKGIPLALLTALGASIALAIHRNLSDLKDALDRSFGMFAGKNLLGAALVALAVVGLRLCVESPRSALGNFSYLTVLCLAGGLVFFGTLAATRAVPLAKLAAAWRRTESS